MTTRCFAQSERLFARGREFMPAGVNSPGRAFGEVDTPPLVIDSASGAWIRDADGNEYLDFMMGLGPCMLGHNPEAVVAAIRCQADRGLVYGINATLEGELAERLVGAVDPIEAIRFTCSGTEAVMSALRVARAHTGRPAVLKFRGGYHGHSDIALARASKKAIRDRASEVRDGLHRFIDDLTLVVDYNDAEAARSVFAARADDLAAVIVEPITSNMGLVKPTTEFLTTLRALCDRHGTVLIFDEVVTGFRYCYGSVSKLLGVVPDMVTLGKIIGGGLAMGAYGGSRELMSHVGEIGSVFQGGTFAGNPLAMAAGLAALDLVEQDGFYQHLDRVGQRFAEVTREGFVRKGIPYWIDHFGGVASYVMVEGLDRLRSFADVRRQDGELFRAFHRLMVERGYLFAPTLEEPIYFSAAHRVEDVAHAAAEAVEVIAELLAQRCRETVAAPRVMHA